MRKYLIVLLIVGLCGCVKSKVSSMKDPDAAVKRYNIVLVNIEEADYQLKKEMEKKEAGLLGKASLARYLTAHELFLPTREYSAEQAKELLSQNNIDAVLTVKSVKDNQTRTVSTIPITTTTSPSFFGGPSTTHTTYNTVVASNVDRAYDIFLFDPEVNKNIWYMSASIRASEAKKVHKRLLSQIARELLRSGFVSDGSFQPE